MLNGRAVLRELKTHFYQLFNARRIPLKIKKGIISITFDDVPQSAVVNAVPVLEKYGLKATFYVAVGLGEDEAVMAQNAADTFVTPDEIKNLHKAGHEIACHTYSHYRLDKGDADGLYADAVKNVSRLKNILGDVAVKHFSYPFGNVDFASKKLLAQQYKSMRSSRPGLNSRVVDMHLLRATSIYNPSFDKEALIEIIRKTEQQRGWLILYTHGVDAQADDYGCTIEQFNWLVEQCVKSSATIMPVGQAYESIMTSGQAGS